MLTHMSGVHITISGDEILTLSLLWHECFQVCNYLFYFHLRSNSLARSLIVVYFRVYERNLVRERKARRLKRWRFWAAGVNDMIAVDQHDKWQRFGLRLYTGIDPFPGVVHWMKIWWTNRNPKLILAYYLDVVENNGCEYPISPSA